MTTNYHYPLDASWSTDEIVSVLHFLNQVELAYESKADATTVLQAYHAFKQVVKSKAQEKQIDKQFGKSSGYSTYKTVQKAKELKKGFFTVEK
ncbi:UPF0223 family protein [Streptococcus halichoeri]|uniref:UPF0223 family protein n=1 Tax=Streptococcus halichoeri TaxID=254785 RepID=UPI0013573E4A|nr:UPF0223 family protein [Streptococcus halichoeri]